MVHTHSISLVLLGIAFELSADVWHYYLCNRIVECDNDFRRFGGRVRDGDENMLWYSCNFVGGFPPNYIHVCVIMSELRGDRRRLRKDWLLYYRSTHERVPARHQEQFRVQVPYRRPCRL